MAVRLKDVAARAGVSVKTASNVINDYPHITPQTRAKVQAAIDELRYRPNLSARRLKHGKAGFLAFALPRITEPYFAEVAAVLAAEATRRGYILLLDPTDGTEQNEQLVLDGMRSHMIDGVIFSPLAIAGERIAARTDDVPMVLLGEREVPVGYDHVAIDSVAAARAMTEHLIALGRRRIASIGAGAHSGTSTARTIGFAQALAHHGFERSAEHEVEPDRWDRESGYAAMHQLLALPERPDAVFCFNDLMAIGALRACREAGVDVPGEIALAGFDDIDETRYSTPTITTIRPDLQLLAQRVLEVLEARIDGDSSDARRIEVPWELLPRESTARATEPGPVSDR
ncbi:LacI family DNA-binding transcriptional regulator [Nakamurella sp. A5-74]|uniref:LacI family DNA-binding transcriptional regulator n=1 Tax=Nakamurella sp. A5-74 TaxID=3158264 RepID=A0AAU8DTT7_9ACTN